MRRVRTPRLLYGSDQEWRVEARSDGLIEVELNGMVMRVGPGADAATVVAVLQALKGVF